MMKTCHRATRPFTSSAHLREWIGRQVCVKLLSWRQPAGRLASSLHVPSLWRLAARADGMMSQTSHQQAEARLARFDEYLTFAFASLHAARQCHVVIQTTPDPRPREIPVRSARNWLRNHPAVATCGTGNTEIHANCLQCVSSDDHVSDSLREKVGEGWASEG